MLLTLIANLFNRNKQKFISFVMWRKLWYACERNLRQFNKRVGGEDIKSVIDRHIMIWVCNTMINEY